MKRTLFFVLTVLVLIGCKGGAKADDAVSGDSVLWDKDTSYAFGVEFGQSIKTFSLKLDYASFTQGLKDVLEDNKLALTEEEAAEKVQTAYLAVMEKQTEGLRQKEIDFLAENAKKSNVQITGSGLQYEVISEGTGPRPQEFDTVQVHYEGTFLSGDVFDSSYSRDEPVEFPLNQVIPGWTEGLQLMSVGSNYRFYIPSNLGYGEQGAGQVIPPFSTLIFDVELLSIK
ncbi:peptidyl-prolyl cis-trans isomerase [Spirochaetia bacterium]|nr:peptidyl-prolyl cis-trans isomerase [Spirochaetia bacterium]GHU94690.1 peptidyl-prolyl cis-trans isomerase [Spirochaetia bacterium]